MSNIKFNAPLSGAAAGYHGHGVSSPYLLPQLMEATNNCVQNFCEVQPGEKVLIVAEYDTDPFVVSSFAASASQVGADVAIMTVNSFSAGGCDSDNPGEMLLGAFERSDVVIACTYFEFAHAEKTFFNKIFGSNKRVCSVLMGATPGCLVTGGRFPVGLFVEIGKRVFAKMDGCKTIRFLTKSGTDLVFEGPQGLGYNEPLKPGTWGIFPLMGINFYPENSNGVFVFDEATIIGRPHEPIKIIIEDNFVTGVEGGSAADVEAINAFANGKYYMRHAVVGLNPKIRMVHAPQFERERAAGTAYLGIDGTGKEGNIDRSLPGFAHLDVIFDTPTVMVDDEILVKDRRLLVLDDPELVEIAGQYGNPTRILAQNPYLW